MSRWVTAVLALLAVTTACARTAADDRDTARNAATVSPKLMTPADLQALPSNPPDFRITYGQDSSNYGQLRVPAGRGPHPVVVLIHGGCWKAQYASAPELGPIGDTLKAQGIATWNIEYRRLGQPGGGWPGTYVDVARGVDHLRAIAGQHNLDLGRVVLVGHSAGGHLAMWAAARRRLTSASALYVANPLPVRGVVNLAGRPDIQVQIKDYERLCGDSVITLLLGGTPATVPDRYAQASPKALLPLTVPQVIVIGTFEDYLPRALADQYVNAAVAAGDSARLIVIPGAGHFEIASPRSAAWAPIESAIRSLLHGN